MEQSFTSVRLTYQPCNHHMWRSRHGQKTKRLLGWFFQVQGAYEVEKQMINTLVQHEKMCNLDIPKVGRPAHTMPSKGAYSTQLNLHSYINTKFFQEQWHGTFEN